MNTGKINENILELIDIIIRLKKENIDNGNCIHPKWQYPKTDIELEMNKLYCENVECSKCKRNYLEGLRKYYKIEYLINDKEIDNGRTEN